MIRFHTISCEEVRYSYGTVLLVLYVAISCHYRAEIRKKWIGQWYSSDWEVCTQNCDKKKWFQYGDVCEEYVILLYTFN